LKIYAGKDKDKVDVRDLSKDSDGDARRLRAGLINPGVPDISYSDIYLVSMFGVMKEIQTSITQIDGSNDFRPWLLTKLLICMIADRGERQRLLRSMDEVYVQTLSKIKIDESSFLYEPEGLDKAKAQKMQSFWFNLTISILPIVGECVSYLNAGLNISQKNQIFEGG